MAHIAICNININLTVSFTETSFNSVSCRCEES